MKAKLLVKPSPAGGVGGYALFAVIEDAEGSHYVQLYSGTPKDCIDMAFELKNANVQREKEEK